MDLGYRLTEAFEEARRLHADDRRKGSNAPYLAHPLAVAALVLEYGGDEDQAIAALLHDTAEDHGGLNQILHLDQTFGPEVADLVRDLSDSLEPEGSPKRPWWTRKATYLQHLAEGAADRALVVSAADKVHNAEATRRDYRQLGDALWGRFHPDSGREGQRWYYRRLAEIYRARRLPEGLVRRLATAVEGLDGEILGRHPELTRADLVTEFDRAVDREQAELRGQRPHPR